MYDSHDIKNETTAMHEAVHRANAAINAKQATNAVNQHIDGLAHEVDSLTHKLEQLSETASNVERNAARSNRRLSMLEKNLEPVTKTLEFMKENRNALLIGVGAVTAVIIAAVGLRKGNHAARVQAGQAEQDQATPLTR